MKLSWKEHAFLVITEDGESWDAINDSKPRCTTCVALWHDAIWHIMHSRVTSEKHLTAYIHEQAQSRRRFVAG